MPQVGTLTASIVVNGVPLREYDPPDAEEADIDGQIARYIEVAEGSAFSIRIALSPATRWRTGYKAFHVYMDGKHVDGWRISQEQTGSRRAGWQADARDVKFFERGTWYKRPFMFKNLQTTDETRKLEELKSIAKGIGCIRIEVFDVTCGEVVPCLGSNHTDSGTVPEKALKGQPIDMSTGFGRKTLATTGRNAYNTTRVGGVLADIVFKYRSRNAPQMLDLIPATPEPQPLEERDINSLNPQEMRELLAQMREQGSQTAEQLAKLKKEADKVKEEDLPGPGPRKRQPTRVEDDDDECMIVEVKKRKVVKNEVDVLDLT